MNWDQLLSVRISQETKVEISEKEQLQLREQKREIRSQLDSWRIASKLCRCYAKNEAFQCIMQKILEMPMESETQQFIDLLQNEVERTKEIYAIQQYSEQLSCLQIAITFCNSWLDNAELRNVLKLY